MDSARSWRGGQNQVLLTATGLARRGHDVRVACRAGGALESRARAAGLDVLSVRYQGDFSPLAAAALRRDVRGRGVDVLHAHDPHALAAALLAGCPRLVASRRVDFPVRGALSRFKYRRCRRVLAVSRAVRQVLRDSGLPEASLRVVYEGVPDRPEMPGGAEQLRRMGVPAEALVVGTVAALTDHKDHETLLRAAALLSNRVPRARFVLVGDGERRPALEHLTRELSLQDRVIFAGFRDDLDCLIPAFDVFCLSSHMEGLGTSVLDAMCFSRPVVVTAAGGLPEPVRDGETGRVVPVRNPEALADALADMLREPDRRAVLGAAGRAAFIAGFTADRMVENTLAVYEEIR